MPDPFTPYSGLGMNVACTPFWRATFLTTNLKVLTLSAAVRTLS